MLKLDLYKRFKKKKKIKNKRKLIDLLTDELLEEALLETGGQWGTLYNPYSRYDFTSKDLDFFDRIGVDIESAQKTPYVEGFMITVCKDDTIKKAVEEYVDDSKKNKYFPSFTERIVGHLARLTDPERNKMITVEYDFGLDFIKNYRDYELKKKDLVTANNIESCLSGENVNTVMFWTYAPYLHEDLTNTWNKNGKECMDILLKWIEISDIDIYKPEKISLDGLEKIREHYILSSNPFGASHRYTRAKAKEIAENLIFI